MMRFAGMLVGMAMLSPVAFAEGRADKTEVIQKLADSLHEAYAKSSASSAVKPKVVVAQVSSTAQMLTEQEVAIVIDKFEALLASSVTVLDRKNSAIIHDEQMFQKGGEVRTPDVKALDQAYGAQQLLVIGFRDQVGKLNADESEITITAKINAYDVESRRLVVSKTIDVKYSDEISRESYHVRDTTSFVLGTTALATGVGGVVAFVGYSTSKSKYDKATTAKDAEAFRKEAETREKIAWAGIGIASLTFLGKCALDYMPRNVDEYHEYELKAAVLAPGVFGLEVAWIP